LRISGNSEVYPLIKWDGLQWEAVDLFNTEPLQINTLKSFSNYLAIGTGVPAGIVYLYNGEKLTKIEEEFNSQIMHFTEFKHQLIVSTQNAGFLQSEGIFSLNAILEDEVKDSSFNLFPNPTKKKFIITYETLENTSTIISIYDALGILIHQEKFNDLKGNYLRGFNLEGHPAGTYIVNIFSKGINETKMIVKN